MKNRVREELGLRGMTQKQLAEGIGMSEIGLSKALDGSATKATIDKIANYLGVEPETLIVESPGFKIKYRGELHLGEFAIPCYVLEDGRRALSKSEMQRALGVIENEPSQRSSKRLDEILTSKQVSRFISDDFMSSKLSTIDGIREGTPIKLYDALVLPEICEIMLKVRDYALSNGLELGIRQRAVIGRADILVRSFAKVGLIALIDEATGYDKVKNRAKDNLQKWLNTFLAEEASRWVKTFPDSFFELIYKMYGWTWTNSPKKPGVVGNIINDWVYLRLGPKVLEELDRLNPKNANGHRAHKHHQNLSETIGKPALQRHLEALKALGAASGYDRARFLDMLNRAYPRPNEQFTFDFGEWE